MVSLKQPICICVECPILNAACNTVSSLPVDDLTVLFCSPLYPTLSFIALVFVSIYILFTNVHTFSFLYIPHPAHVHFCLSLSLLTQLCFQHTSLLLPLNPAVTSPLLSPHPPFFFPASIPTSPTWFHLFVSLLGLPGSVFSQREP